MPFTERRQLFHIFLCDFPFAAISPSMPPEIALRACPRRWRRCPARLPSFAATLRYFAGKDDILIRHLPPAHVIARCRSICPPSPMLRSRLSTCQNRRLPPRDVLRRTDFATLISPPQSLCAPGTCPRRPTVRATPVHSHHARRRTQPISVTPCRPPLMLSFFLRKQCAVLKMFDDRGDVAAAAARARPPLSSISSPSAIAFKRQADVLRGVRTLCCMLDPRRRRC